MTSLSVDVPIIDDDIFELSEFFNGLLSLGDPIQSSFVTITEPTARVEIISDDSKFGYNSLLCILCVDDEMHAVSLLDTRMYLYL